MVPDMPATTLVFLLSSSVAVLCVHGQGSECEVLRKELDDLKLKYEADLKALTGQLEKRNLDLESKNTALEVKLQDLATWIVEPLAFSAALTNTIEVSEGDVIKFDFEFVDTHGLHNPDVGIITIPETGIYEVNVNIFKYIQEENNIVYADLCVNSAPLTRIYHRYKIDTEATAHGSVTIIREFTIGNTLYVRAGNAATYFGDVPSRSQFNVKYLGKMQENA